MRWLTIAYGNYVAVLVVAMPIYHLMHHNI